MKSHSFIIISLFVTIECTSQNFFGRNTPEKIDNKPIVSLPNMPNKVDEKGRKQGVWAKKYSNGQYSYIAHFIDNVPVDTTIRFDENGKRSSIQVHLDANKCKAIIYDEDGRMQSEGHYVNEKKDGEWNYYRMNGKIASREFYKNGLLNGTATTYFESGDIFEEIQYIDGVPSGFWRQFHFNGKKQLETTFLIGQLDGTYKCWNEGGTITVDGKYSRGVKVGDWKIFDTDDGTYFIMKYNSKGSLLNKEEFERRNALKMENYERNSKTISDPEKYRYNPEEYK